MKPSNRPAPTSQTPAPSTGDCIPEAATNGAPVRAKAKARRSAKGKDVPLPMSEREFKKKNQRRIDLILKDTDHGLTPEETSELARLKQEIDEYARVKFSAVENYLDLAEERARKVGYIP